MASLVSTAISTQLGWKYATQYALCASTDSPLSMDTGHSPVSRDYRNEELPITLLCQYCTSAWHDDGNGRCSACGAPYGNRSNTVEKPNDDLRKTEAIGWFVSMGVPISIFDPRENYDKVWTTGMEYMRSMREYNYLR